MDFSTLPSILTPDLGLLFWMLLAFLVVFFVLAKFGFPAIIGMVEKRKKYIDESLSKAQKAAAQLENIKRGKQAAILKEAAATREAIVAQALEKAREESARIINDAKAEIESQKQAAISEIRQQVAALSVEISEKVLRQKLNTDKAQMDYINQMLDEVTANNK